MRTIDYLTLGWIAAVFVVIRLLQFWREGGVFSGWAPLGIVGVIGLLGIAHWRRHRNRARWWPAGRKLGFKPLYSGHFPAIPFETEMEPKDLLLRATAGTNLYVGTWVNRIVRCPDSYNTLNSEPSVEDIPLETFALYWLPGITWPAFEIRPRNLKDRLVTPLGRVTTRNPDFEQRYQLLDSSDFDLAAMIPQSFLNQISRSPGWHIRANGEWLLCSHDQTMINSSDLPTFVRDTDAIVSAWCTSVKAAPSKGAQ